MLHKLALLNTSPYSSGAFVCNICRESGCGPVYHCADCDFDVHVMCAAVAKQQTHITHPHHLLHLVQCSTQSHTCDSCGITIHNLSFRCDKCDFDIHPTCVRAPRFIQHPTHHHPLTLTPSQLSTSFAADSADGRKCEGCKRPVNRYFYKCDRCNYVLHQSCASLPTRMKHHKHPQHLLMLLDKPPLQEEGFVCGECGARSRGWRFNCAKCNFSLHPGCATAVHEFMQPVPDPELSTQGGSEAMSTTTTSIDTHKVSHASTALLQAHIPSDKEWEAFEKVVQFARELATGHSSVDVSSKSSQSGMNEEDICPTCLEGYDGCNPKKLTSCGHHFHLACILNWMEISPFCPICRSKGVSVRM